MSAQLALDAGPSAPFVLTSRTDFLRCMPGSVGLPMRHKWIACCRATTKSRARIHVRLPLMSSTARLQMPFRLLSAVQ